MVQGARLAVEAERVARSEVQRLGWLLDSLGESALADALADPLADALADALAQVLR